MSYKLLLLVFIIDVAWSWAPDLHAVSHKSAKTVEQIDEKKNLLKDQQTSFWTFPDTGGYSFLWGVSIEDIEASRDIRDSERGLVQSRKESFNSEESFYFDGMGAGDAIYWGHY